MNFKLNKRKLTWSLVISVFGAFGTILSAYLSPLRETGEIKNISAATISSMKPLWIFYLLIYFVLIYIIWVVVVYVIFSFSEKSR